jgi:hypothetical protein
MIGTIRKHSTWLWGIVITATVISFVYWGSYTGGGNYGAGADQLGSIMDRPVTRQEFNDAFREMQLRYFFSSGQWFDGDVQRSGFDPTRETYFRLLLLRKAKQVQIHVSLEATARTASELLRQLSGGSPVPLSEFVKQVLAPRQLTGADFERYVRNEMTISQLLGLASMSGRLITPQDARAVYEREHQQYVTQAVFYNPSNYVADVKVTPEALGQFFTNQLALRYRIPERVRVSYVRFDATNYLAEALADINAQFTNLAEVLEAEYQQRGGTNFYTDKSADDAKAEILRVDQEQRALLKARARANAFASVVMDSEPIRVETFAAVAQASNLTVEVTAPFTPNEPPAGLNVGQEFIRAAFMLTETEPVAGPVMSTNAAFVIASHSRLPSEVPNYEDVKERVQADYTFYESAMAARAAATALSGAVSNALATGGTFAAACSNAGAAVITIPPFSMSSTNVPEVEKHVDLNQFKQAVFLTPAGKATGFVPNNEGGGFIAFVEKTLPVEDALASAAVPEYMRSIRQARQNDAANHWVSSEATRDPGFRAIMDMLGRRDQPAGGGAAAPLN